MALTLIDDDNRDSFIHCGHCISSALKSFNFIHRITFRPFSRPLGLAVWTAGHLCVSKFLCAVKDATHSPIEIDLKVSRYMFSVFPPPQESDWIGSEVAPKNKGKYDQ